MDPASDDAMPTAPAPSAPEGTLRPADPGPWDRLVRALDRLDRRLAGGMADHGITVLRAAIGLVFVWFGALKVVGESPVADLARRTLYWLEPGLLAWVRPGLVVPLLGAFEVALGLALLAGVALRLTLALLWLHLAGTFAVFVARPDEAFRGGNPLLLTATGEFVVKNLVLIAGGIVVGSTVHGRRLRLPGLDG